MRDPHRADPLSYGPKRDGFQYLAVALEWARRHCPAPTGGRTPRLLEVGGGIQRGCRYLERLPEFERTVVDCDPDRGVRLPGVELVFSRFEDWPVSGDVVDGAVSHHRLAWDVALCLQVLEHVPDPAAFFRKLAALARVVIVSVPYCWPEGKTAGHRHDPIGRAKLAGWTGLTPVDQQIVHDSRTKRLVSSYLSPVQALPAT